MASVYPFRTATSPVSCRHEMTPRRDYSPPRIHSPVTRTHTPNSSQMRSTTGTNLTPCLIDSKRTFSKVDWHFKIILRRELPPKAAVCWSLKMVRKGCIPMSTHITRKELFQLTLMSHLVKRWAEADKPNLKQRTSKIARAKKSFRACWQIRKTHLATTSRRRGPSLSPTKLSTTMLFQPQITSRDP